MADSPEIVAVVIARVPAAGVEAFLRYERVVLPLLADVGAKLERRLQSSDGRIEIHLVRFPSEDAIAQYRSDARRAAAQELVGQSRAAFELHILHDAPLDYVLGPPGA